MEFAMVRWRILILSLLIVTLPASAVVHATVFAANGNEECAWLLHGEEPAEQMEEEMSKSAPHHHGHCHGAASLQSSRGLAPPSFRLLMSSIGVLMAATFRDWAASPGLRPPII